MSRRWLVRSLVAFAVVPPVVASCAQSDFTNLQADGGVSEAGADALVEEEDIELPCDPEEKPTNGIFVSATVGVEAGNGSADAPLRTLASALPLAAARGVDVYVDEGTYPESLTLDASFGGLAIRGGWKAGTPWKRDCEGDFRVRTILASPEPVGVRVRVDGPAPRIALEALTIATSVPQASAEDASGVSTYGIFVEGRALVLLDKVRVVAGRAGDAGKAPATVTGDRIACDGLNACSAGAAGASAPVPGRAAIVPGGFSVDGFVPADGRDGAPGEAGQNGFAGENLTHICYNGMCHGACNNPVDGDHCTECDRADQKSQGRCGCGGAPGGAGRGGRGGGASIGVFVAGGALAVERTRLMMAGGGAGASGEAGGDGGEGGGGAPGPNVTCLNRIARGSGPAGEGCFCRSSGTTPKPAGSAGGPGGRGGQGSAGGGGAGGSVYGVVLLGDAQFTKDDVSRFSLGEPGAGAGGAAIGAQGEQLRVPASELPDADVR